MNYKVDLFAIFIFLGIVQAIFLSYFFLTGENRKVQANFFQGILLLAIAFNIIEIFIMYTGYIVNCLYLVDFSEPIAFVIGPSLYLMIRSRARGEVECKQYLHFITPFIYFILLFPFFLTPDDVKYNAYISAYHPDFPFREVNLDFDPRWNWFTHHPTELILTSLFIYIILSSIEIRNAYHRKGESFWKTTNPILVLLRAEVIVSISLLFLVAIVKLFNRNDTGDHLFAAYISLTVYFTSFRVIRNSGFFKQASLVDAAKYKGSTLSSEQKENILSKLKQVMENEKPYLNPLFSLPDLSDKLKFSVHQLSQAINEGLNKSFFELTAEYRVNEAKQLLKDQPNIKIEEIAEQVGYSSKSSFNTVFKKITGKTPSEYRSQTS
ncbi:MAG: AraC family transcriptional regulator [Bacteroidetes bacterium]|nr:AraC family transcriptional regulator [Bacteroidota bacterium]MBI3483369.1 AraC family transcriptional regulator [Bacteroidota bacterium]